MYLNGILVRTESIVASNITYQEGMNFRLGARTASCGTYYPTPFNGRMEEVRLWDVARTETQIREDMHLSLDGCESNLVYYSQFNDGTGSGTLTDNSANANTGTLTNMASASDWVTSGVNVGNDATPNSNSQSIASVPTGVSTQNFAAANLSIDFTAHSAVEDICVTYENFTPNATTGASGTNLIDNPMWTVNKSTSTATQTMDMTFTFPVATLTTSDLCHLQLYNRAMNSDGSWTLISGRASAATATTVTFDGVTATGQFMVVEDNAAGGDIVRDEALDFDGANDYVNLPTSVFPLGATGTIEQWVYVSNTGSNMLLYTGDNTSPSANGWGDAATMLECHTALSNSKVNFTYQDGAGATGSFKLTSLTALPLGTWHHYAITWDVNGMAYLYVDGILEVSGDMSTTTFAGRTPTFTYLGRPGANTRYSTGPQDELRIWTTIRTAQEIRENMHLTLDGCETGLQAYYQFNDGTGSSAVTDKSGNGNDGTLTNMDPATDWITSGVNVGNDASGNSNSQSIATVPAGLSTQNFASANLSIDFTAHSAIEDICVTYENFTPNATTGASGTSLIDNPMWTVNKSTSTATQTMDMTFTFPVATLTTTDLCQLKLYNRAMNSDGSWTLISGKATAATATTVTFDGITATGQFMVVENTATGGDIVRDEALDFDGVNDYVEIPNDNSINFSRGTPFAITIWVKPASIQSDLGNIDNDIIEKWGGAGAYPYVMRYLNQSAGANAGKISVGRYNGSSSTGLTSTTTLDDDEWHHIAFTSDGSTLSLYIDGVLQGTSAELGSGTVANSDAVQIGRRGNNINRFKGEIDELRFWNTVRTEDQIRENMHLTLTGCETGLQAYYQFNDGNPSTTLTDKTGNGNDGTLTNMDPATDWITSGVNVGNDASGNSNSQSIATVPAGLSTQNFASANLSIDFTAHSAIEDICVTYENFTPNATTGASGTSLIDNPMWTVNKSTSTATQTMDMTFTFPVATLTTTDLCQLKLYNRAMNSDGSWTLISGKATAATATTVTFDGITATGQFMVVEDNTVGGDINRDEVLDFDGTNDYVNVPNTASLDFTTGTLEAWVRPESTSNDNRSFLAMRTGTGGNTRWSAHLNVAGNTIGIYNGSSFSTVSATLNINELYHIALVITTTNTEVFLNGISLGFTGNGLNAACVGKPLTIATPNDPVYPNELFVGDIDEVRVWNTARTAQEICENMHLTLDGCETGLVAYYQFNEGSGTTLNDKSGNGNNGTLNNGPIWENSAVNVGNDASGNSNSQTIASVPTGVSTQNFAAANLSIDFTAHSAIEDICVTYENFTPNTTTGASGTNIIDNPMWTVNKSTSTATQTMNMTFTFPVATLTTTDLCQLKLYNRAMNGDGSWTLLGSASAATATTVTFDGVTATGQFMVVENTATGGDITRDKALNFDGTNDYVDVLINVNENEYTCEFWFKTSNANCGLFSVDKGTLGSAGHDRHIFLTGGNIRTRVWSNEILTTSGVNYADGEWHHIALVLGSSIGGERVYVDGILKASGTKQSSDFTAQTGMNIGFSQDAASDYLMGEIDELRIWKIVRTEQDIRENMHLTLDGCEPGLQAYYQFNEGSGTSLIDKTGNGHDGTLTNMDPATDWVTSAVNVGNDASGNSNSQTIASVPTGVSTQNFAAANLSIDFTAHSAIEDICVTYENFTPNATTGASGTNLIDNPMWTVNKSTSTATQTMDITFTFPVSTLTTTDLCQLKLYNRAMNGDGTWTQVGGNPSAATATTVTFDGLTATGQFMVVEGSNSIADINRDNALDFDGINSDTELPNSLITAISQDLTIEAWVKPRTTGGWESIVHNMEWTGGGSPVFSGYSLVIHPGGIIRASIFTGTNNQYSIVSPTGISTGTWSHVAMTYEGTTLSIFINGVLVASQAASGAIDYNPSPLGYYIGRYHDSNESHYFDGEIEEVRLWDVARTEDEIRENMHLTLGGCDNGLIGYWQMNEGSGTTVADKSGNGHTGTLNGGTAWTTSGVNVGNDASGNSNSETIATVPAGVSTQNFASANLSMSILEHSAIEDICVTYQEFTPNATTGADGFNIIQNPMWTVNKSTSTATLLGDYTFTFPPATFTSLDPSKYSLYWRPMNEHGTWTKVETANAVTATTATFGKISLTGQFMVVQESDALVSDVRGNMYDFTATSGRVLIPNAGAKVSAASLGLPTTNLTVEAWCKLQSIAAYRDIVSFVQDNGGTEHGWELGIGGTGLMGRVAGGGTGLATVYAPLTLNEWHHVAMTYDGAMIRLYVDGVEISTLAEAGNISYIDSWLVIGGYKDDNEDYFHEGAVDEVRIWTTTRTLSELRENMHLTLKGNETGLLSYYQFNNDDAVGTVGGVKDAMGINNGTATNMAASNYIASEVAVAGGTSDRITISASGVVNFPNTGVSVEFGGTHPNGELVISRLETEKPHGWSTLTGDVDNEYFVVNNYGTNQTFTVLPDITFNRMSYISPTDVGVPQASSPLTIYKRKSNDYGATWGTNLGGVGADNADAGTNGMVSFNTNNPISTFSQIVIVNSGLSSGLPVDLLNFDAERINAEKVQLDWSTATETNNRGFEIERMLENETEFQVIDFIDGQGTTVNTTNYQFIDENSYIDVSYYRLKQMDDDGTFTYSDIKAVAGEGNKNTTYIDVTVYPNPVYDELKVRFNELPEGVTSANVQIMSINGQILHEFTAALQSYQVLEIEYVGKLTPAMYMLSIEMSNGEKVLQKFIKQ